MMLSEHHMNCSITGLKHCFCLENEASASAKKCGDIGGRGSSYPFDSPVSSSGGLMNFPPQNKLSLAQSGGTFPPHLHWTSSPLKKRSLYTSLLYSQEDFSSSELLHALASKFVRRLTGEYEAPPLPVEVPVPPSESLRRHKAKESSQPSPGVSSAATSNPTHTAASQVEEASAHTTATSDASRHFRFLSSRSPVPSHLLVCGSSFDGGNESKACSLWINPESSCMPEFLRNGVLQASPIVSSSNDLANSFLLAGGLCVDPKATVFSATTTGSSSESRFFSLAHTQTSSQKGSSKQEVMKPEGSTSSSIEARNVVFTRFKGGGVSTKLGGQNAPLSSFQSVADGKNVGDIRHAIDASSEGLGRTKEEAENEEKSCFDVASMIEKNIQENGCHFRPGTHLLQLIPISIALERYSLFESAKNKGKSVEGPVCATSSSSPAGGSFEDSSSSLPSANKAIVDGSIIQTSPHSSSHIPPSIPPANILRSGEGFRGTARQHDDTHTAFAINQPSAASSVEGRKLPLSSESHLSSLSSLAKSRKASDNNLFAHGRLQASSGFTVCTPSPSISASNAGAVGYTGGVGGADTPVSEGDESDCRIELACHFRHCKHEADKKELLLCVKCRRAFHAGCCDPALNYQMVTRYPWSCTECKACETCGSNANEDTMLICDACDRAYHMECMSPSVEEVPDGDWFCLDCGYCRCCGARLPDKEALNPTCSYNSRFRICSGCREKNSRTTHTRRSKSKKLDDEDMNLCSVCVKPSNLAANNEFTHTPDGERSPSKFITCFTCGQGAHPGCCVASSHSSSNVICLICSQIEKDIGFSKEIAQAS